MIYIYLIIALIIMGILFYSIDNLPKNKAYVIASFVLIWFVMAFRSISVGTDTATYQEKFNLISNLKIFDILSSRYVFAIESGFALIMKLCSLIVPNYYFFQIILSALTVILYAKFICDNIENSIIGVIGYVGSGLFGYSLNISRQIFAMGIMINAWTYFQKKSYKKAVVLVLISISIHFISVIYIALYIFHFLLKSKLLEKIVVPVMMVFSCSILTFLPYVAELFPHYAKYFTYYDIKSQSAGGIFIFWIFILSISGYNIYSKKGKYNSSVKKDRKMIDISVYSSMYVAGNFAGLYFNLLERIGIMFLPFTLILIDDFSKNLKGDLRKIYILVIILFFVAYYLLKMLTSQQYIYSFL